jgi:hypothetical protein
MQFSQTIKWTIQKVLVLNTFFHDMLKTLQNMSDGSHLSRNTTYWWLSVSDLLVPSYLELWRAYCFSLSLTIMPATLLIQLVLGQEPLLLVMHCS